MPENFDLLVLGGGPGGVAAAIRAHHLGATVGLIEIGQWGGLCLNKACIPTKLLMATVDRAGTVAQAANFGFQAPTAELDPAAVWGLKNDLVGYFSMGTKGLAGSHGVNLIEGRGKLAGLGQIEVDGQVYSAPSIIVASGAEFVRPDIPGGDLPGVVSSTQFLDQETIPAKAIFLGGGPWSLEMAQFLTAAGGEAIVVESGREILPGEDEEITQRLRRILTGAGLNIMTGATVDSLTASGDRITAAVTAKGQTEELTVDRVVYFDRRPALDDLGLDTVGLTDLSVNDQLATDAAGIWALGDVTGQPPFLSHRASGLGLVAAENALGAGKTVSTQAIPRVLYTRPQVGMVGLTEDQAEDADYDVITGEVPLGVSPMASIMGQAEGMIKVIGEEKYGELLGVHIIAPNASELIAAAALAIQMEATLEDLAYAAFAHPTISESLADAAREALGWAIYLPK